MKTKAMLIAMLIVLAEEACLFGQQPSPSPPPRALAIVVDTSWSTDRYEATFRSLARQAAATLQSGDYLEILTARPSSPSIKLAATIRAGSPEEIRSIDAVLATIHAQFLSTASIANALEVAFARLNEVSSKRAITNVTAIVFTRCEISSEEAMRVLALADKFSARNWSLYLTGTRNTNRDILMGANRRTLMWRSISEANPALWLAKNEPEGPLAKKKQEPTPEPKPPERPSVQPPVEAPRTLDKPEERMAHPGRPPTTPGQGYQVTVGTTVQVAPPQRLTGEAAATLPPGPALEPNKPSEPPVKPLELGPPQKKVASPGHPLWARLKGLLQSYWWLIPLTVALSGLIIVISKDIMRAGRWNTKKKQHLASTSREPKRLAVRYGDDYRDLGRLDRFRSIHVGPGKKNTIRTPTGTGGERYLKLYRRGDDVMLKNLAPSSILANNIEVKPGGKQRLVIPSAIQLPDKTKLNLDFVRPETTAAPTERNTSHGQHTERQRVE